MPWTTVWAWWLGPAPAWVWLLVPPLALAIDCAWGEPPARWHPVVWMGSALGWWGTRIAPAAPTGPDVQRAVAGAMAWCGLALSVVTAAWGLQALLARSPAWCAVPLLALLLKPLLAWRMLRDEVAAVEQALAATLTAGRERLAWLVSRDTQTLQPHEVREAAVETLAENLNDSVVAPLFWFALLGLPGAALYRLANTADAMWGYPGMRSGRYWQWAGKWAARADDVLSWVPARITAVLLWAGGVGRTRCSWATLRTEARRTPSPNSGWPMAAMALRLGVRLGKPGVYVLNPRGGEVRAAHMPQALRHAGRAVGGALAVVVLVQGVLLWLR
ncbi:MAG: adenosylcobinamide-phosphate synthase CbiB [Burkholderiaceae bacterium]